MNEHTLNSLIKPC